MGGRSSSIQRASLSALHYAGIDSLAAGLSRGTGAIFALHHVKPATPMAFAPNRHLEVTPEFLDRTIRLVMERGYDVISLDDARMRLAGGDLARPFVCFTFDDGYRDVLQHGYPVFKRHELPFAVYIASDFADGHGNIWWRALENLVRNVDVLELKIDGTLQHFACERPAAKTRAFTVIHRWLERQPEHDARQIVADLCWRHEIDTSGLCGELAMSWEDVRVLARDPLVTIGAHTRCHVPLGPLSYAEARAEIDESCARVGRETGRPCRHFSFPDGGVGPREFQLAREAGLTTSVTSHRGLLMSHHASAMDALPRITLNGDLQKPHYVKVLLSGVPFALDSATRRMGLRRPSVNSA
jgi:peptidoglycan/xylan/chitin deacetylase (PgdA/CDA1 family)